MGERAALIAVRLAPGRETRAPEAVVVGTLEDAADWRCACWPLDRLLDRLRAGEPLLAPLDAAVIAGALGHSPPGRRRRSAGRCPVRCHRRTTSAA